MILKKLCVYSFTDEELLNEYTFNENGVNIILGEKKDDADEANGVGKTTAIECISFLLGEAINEFYTKNKIIISKKIFITLSIDHKGEIVHLGRYFNNPEKGYILSGVSISFKLEGWEEFEDSQYKGKIQEIMFKHEYSDIKFASVREYIIRDEQNGFIKNSLGIVNRGVSQINKVLAFLCNVPYTAESEIKKLTNEINKLLVEKDAITGSIGKTLAQLNSLKTRISSQITKIERDINAINIAKQYNVKIKEYDTLKTELNSIQQRVFKLQHIKTQYQNNIENLKKKSQDIKELDDLEEFYNQLIGWFPKHIKENYDQITHFYDFMVENRGSFYQSKIIGIDNEVEKLQSEKVKLEKALKADYKILNQTNLIEDINAIIGDREELNTQLAEVNIQIGHHEKVNTLKREIATLKGQRLTLTQQKMDEFNSHENYIEKLESKFHELSQIAYDILGSFNVEFETDVSDKKDSTTGRIKIKCTLPDDRSHGINYMKINLFDLTWFLTSLENAYGHQLELLIHDGSYSKPNPTVKAKILKYVNTSLIGIGKGQYFVTLNKDELLATDIDEFKKQGLVTVLLERTQDNKKRFFGFKLYE